MRSAALLNYDRADTRKDQKMNGQVEEGTRADLKENHSFNTYYQFMLPLGADKMDHYSKAVFSV